MDKVDITQSGCDESLKVGGKKIIVAMLLNFHYHFVR